MNVLVIGAAGFIGGAIVAKLKADSHEVIEAVHKQEDEQGREWIEVEHPDGVDNFVSEVKGIKDLDAVIYAVGHCPAGGFADAVRRPLSELDCDDIDKEVDMHIRGPFNVFKGFASAMNEGASFVIVSSAITRFLNRPLPPGINFSHHAGAIAAMDWLIRGMRDDPVTKRYGLKIHRIAPAAVDTPFHAGGKIPLVPMDRVVNAVLGSLVSDRHVDEELLAG